MIMVMMMMMMMMMMMSREDPTMMRNGCLTLCQFNIPQDVLFDYERLVTIIIIIIIIMMLLLIMLMMFLLMAIVNYVDGEW